MRYTEYHNGVAVIKDRTLLSQALAKLAEYEDAEGNEPPECGYWVDAFRDGTTARCSVCGSTYAAMRRDFLESYRYCPNCGVKMESVEWEEDEE